MDDFVKADQRPIIICIIPCFNDAVTLPRAVNSVLTQKGLFDIEILIVNDGSTDHTSVAAQSLAEIDSRVKVIAKENGGLSSARNVGIRNASGEFVHFLDADDYLRPGVYKAMFKAAQFHPGALVHCSFEMIDLLTGEIQSCYPPILLPTPLEAMYGKPLDLLGPRSRGKSGPCIRP